MDDAARLAAIAHAQAEWPKEACGIFVTDGDLLRYQPCQNRAYFPNDEFHIVPGDYEDAMRAGTLRGIFHSHPGGQLEPSFADMQAQIAMDLPYFVCTLSPADGGYRDFWGFGDQLPRAPMLHRDFRSGVHDCYATYRDYNWLALGKVTPDYPRSPDWWDDARHDNPFDVVFSWEHYDLIENPDDMQPGDGLLFALRNNIVMHCGVYIGDGLFLHHLHGKASRRDPFVQWQRFLRQIVRYRGNT